MDHINTYVLHLQLSKLTASATYQILTSTIKMNVHVLIHQFLVQVGMTIWNLIFLYSKLLMWKHTSVDVVLKLTSLFSVQHALCVLRASVDVCQWCNYPKSVSLYRKPNFKTSTLINRDASANSLAWITNWGFLSLPQFWYRTVLKRLLCYWNIFISFWLGIVCCLLLLIAYFFFFIFITRSHTDFSISII